MDSASYTYPGEQHLQIVIMQITLLEEDQDRAEVIIVQEESEQQCKLEVFLLVRLLGMLE